MLKQRLVLFFLLPLAGAAAQPTFTVAPESATGKDWLQIEVRNDYQTCDVFFNHEVERDQTVGGQAIRLYDEVHHAEVCTLPIDVHVDFSVPPLYPGTYTVFHGEIPYCDTTADTVCPDYDVDYVEMGTLEVSDPSGDEVYIVKPTGRVCITEPCEYFSVESEGTRDTVFVAAVQDTTGEYACALCDDIKWWEGKRLHGYIHSDSQPGWITRGNAFAITGLAETSSVPDHSGFKDKLGADIGYNALSGRLWFSLPAQEYPVTVRLYNTAGIRVASRSLPDASEGMDVSHLPEGVYQLHLRTSRGLIQKVLKL